MCLHGVLCGEVDAQAFIRVYLVSYVQYDDIRSCVAFEEEMLERLLWLNLGF